MTEKLRKSKGSKSKRSKTRKTTPAEIKKVSEQLVQVADTCPFPSAVVGIDIAESTESSVPSTCSVSADPSSMLPLGDEVVFSSSPKDDTDIAEVASREQNESLWVDGEYKKEMKAAMISCGIDRVFTTHLGLLDASNIVKAEHECSYLEANIISEALIDMMGFFGYKFVGIFAYNPHENAFVKVAKQTWKCDIDGVEIRRRFIYSGNNLYVHKTTGETVAISIARNINTFVATISVVHVYLDAASELLKRILEHVSRFSMLSGRNLKSLSAQEGSFEIFDTNSSNNWENYYYDKKVKEVVETDIVDFITNLDIMMEIGISRRGVMFVGPPGTGKTTLGRIICNLIGNHATVIWASPGEICINSPKTVYRIASILKPAIIILEDLDLYSEDRDNQIGNIKLGSLMNILDGVGSADGVVTIATSNRPELIEKALKSRPGRFDRITRVDKMATAQRKKMIYDRLAKWDTDEDALDMLSAATEDQTGAVVQEVIHTILMKAKREGSKRITKEMANVAIATMADHGHELKRQKQIGFGAIVENAKRSGKNGKNK